MNSAELVRLFRKDMADETLPPLWSDEEIYGYADTAQKTFARETGGIADSTTQDLTQISVDVAATTFPFSSKILKISGAYRVSDGRPVEVVNYADMTQRGIRFDGRTGPIEAIVIGMDAAVAYFYPVPSVADTLQLMVDRLPLLTLVFSSPNQALEIDEHHHRHLLLGMKELAYGKQDAETFDKSKAKEFGDAFEQYCFKAKLERDRVRHKKRVVAYGGIPMQPGFISRSSRYY